MVSMEECMSVFLLMISGEIARYCGPRRSAAVNGRSRTGQGRKRASRAAIDSENGVAPCHTAISPDPLLLF
jgi:hypothetical protein